MLVVVCTLLTPWLPLLRPWVCLFGSSSTAMSKAGQLECLAAGGAIGTFSKEDIRPSNIMTRKGFLRTP